MIGPINVIVIIARSVFVSFGAVIGIGRVVIVILILEVSGIYGLG